MLALYQRQLYRKSRKSDWRVVLGESHSSARVGAGGSHSLVSVQAQDWVSRDAVTRRYTGGSELGFCPEKLLVPGSGGTESSTVAAKGSEGRRLLQLCVVVKFPGGRGVLCLASIRFLEEIPSVTVEALRWNEDMESEALSGVVVMKDYG
ncbi:hypothetical protein F2Q68_00032458 [Brassica cretica]|uniref:Uncharacterized protein n=1 Tax=Brassica cretica TaxID=69181 RepID=A0A8S9G2E3_BRACR|nr:hypothetical protein F2Q68_00032458 [Brassica cretica]